MLLLRGATKTNSEPFFGSYVSIHAPLARSNVAAPLLSVFASVSIHAPLARSNVTIGPDGEKKEFQYMLLLRGAIDFYQSKGWMVGFQYMLLLRGANDGQRIDCEGHGFNTCSSCEEQMTVEGVENDVNVSIHAPLARSNGAEVLPSFEREVSIHAPLARSKFF